MSCYIPKPCSQIPEIADGYLEIALTDSDEKIFNVRLDRNSQFLDGSLQGLGSDSCIMPFFGQTSSRIQSWFLGDVFMSEYYTVFDMTPHDEFGQDYIQVGIAKANPSDEIGEALLEKSRKFHEQSMSSTFWVIILFIFLSVAVGYACVQHNKQSQFEIDRLDYDGLEYDGLDKDRSESVSKAKYDEIYAKAYAGPTES